jgi:hypothetical protein
MNSIKFNNGIKRLFSLDPRGIIFGNARPIVFNCLYKSNASRNHEYTFGFPIARFTLVLSRERPERNEGNPPTVGRPVGGYGSAEP